MLPLIAGMLLLGPISGFLSDRFGPRPFATAGMLGTAAAFYALLCLPVDFSYPVFALVLFLMGAALGLFMSPNRAGVMNSLPSEHRGAGGGMNQTFQNSSQVFSIGLFFTLMVIGLSSRLPSALSAGLRAHGVPEATATRVGHTPPISVLFAAFLGYNPIQHLLGPDALGGLTEANRQVLTGRAFFPTLITDPFRSGLHAAFACAIVLCVLGAAASLARGQRFVHGEAEELALDEGEQLASAPSAV
jgi:MFS family permease